VWWAATFGGPFLVKTFSGENHDHQASPIRNGVSEERANVRVIVRNRIKNDPENEDSGGNEGERVFAKDGPFPLLRSWHSRPLEKL
jgi:hypothetical protein